MAPSLHRHGPYRFRVTSDGSKLAWFEVSLARVLFGTNCRVLANQSEINDALDAVRSFFAQIADVPLITEWPIPARIDLSWQYDVQSLYGVPALAFIKAHCGAKHSAVQSSPVLRDNSITWLGAKTIIQLYGKSRKLSLGDDILRLEVRLKAGAVKKFFHQDEWFIFSRLWACFRMNFIELSIIQLPAMTGSLPEAIGRVVPTQFHELILAALGHKKPRTIRSYRRRFAAAASQLPESFSWLNALPIEETRPPAIVKKHPRKTASKVRRKLKTPHTASKVVIEDAASLSRSAHQ